MAAVTEIFFISLPNHRTLDRLSFTEVMVAAQAACGTIGLSHFDVRGPGEAWKLHRLADLPANGVLAVVGPPTCPAQTDPLADHLVNLIARAWRSDVTLCVVGGGEFLANSGLLTGRTVACAKPETDRLKSCFPNVMWDDSSTCVRDGFLISSCGLLAGCEAALALFQTLCTESVYSQVTAMLGLGAGSPSKALQPVKHSRGVHPAVQRVLAEIHGPYLGEWSTASLAKVACVSERHLQRLFREELGCGVLDYLHRWRLTKAVRLLEAQPRENLDRIAEIAGFTSGQQLRRVWRREFGQVPSRSRKPAIASARPALPSSSYESALKLGSLIAARTPSRLEASA